PGQPLNELIAAEGRLPAERAVEIARQIAAGLAGGPDAGGVHRDLKPGDILVDDSGRAAISDFGVARSLAGPGPTLPGAVVGTLDYLSPEQARGGEVDGRADLYALGILLHEMLTGELPFAGGSAAEVLAQRLTGGTRDLRAAGGGGPPPPRPSRPRVPPGGRPAGAGGGAPFGGGGGGRPPRRGGAAAPPRRAGGSG